MVRGESGVAARSAPPINPEAGLIRKSAQWGEGGGLPAGFSSCVAGNLLELSAKSGGVEQGTACRGLLPAGTPLKRAIVPLHANMPCGTGCPCTAALESLVSPS